MALHYLRDMLAKQLEWEEAHVGYRDAVADLAPELRGVVPDGLGHSAWELLEHLRIAQRDILDFCVYPAYVEPSSMAEYWPVSAAPPSEEAWDESIERFEDDLHALQALARNEEIDLFARVPNGDGQTYLRELLLVADHNAYHVAQLICVRKALGAWQPRPGW